MKKAELREGFELVERLADGGARERDRIETYKAAERLIYEVLRGGGSEHQLACELHNAARKTILSRAAFLGRGASAALDYPSTSGFFLGMKKERIQQAALVREIFGSTPPAPSAANWRAVALPLAQAAYEERQLPSGHLDSARLAILSDALEEAGCADAGILSHLRSTKAHVRGCWALDLVLKKE
jgi:hypothetical protein